MNPIRIERILATKNPNAFQVEVAQDVDTTQLVVGTGNTFGFLPSSSTTRRSWPTFSRTMLDQLGIFEKGQEVELVENDRGKKEVVNFNRVDISAKFKELYGKQARLVIVENQKPVFEGDALLNKPKLNPQTKMYLLKDGQPIFRNTVLVTDDSIKDQTIKHDSEVDESTVLQILRSLGNREVVMM